MHMENVQELHNLAADQLFKTSRTFFIPISQLPSGLWEAVTSAYLCMRAIDEIEDHTSLHPDDKKYLLYSISGLLQNNHNNLDSQIEELFKPYFSMLPEVSYNLSAWIRLAPTSIVHCILDSTATMAGGMAQWVEKNWSINTEQDLDQYTYYVAGLVGIMLSDLWIWYDERKTDRDLAIAFGRGLQAVNIIRNRNEDLTRGVDYFPNGWSKQEMFSYAKRNLQKADLYTELIGHGPIYNFCKIPLTLAHATLDAIEAGEQKLTRNEVIHLVQPFTSQ